MTSLGTPFLAFCLLVFVVGCDAEQSAGKRGQGQINSGIVISPPADSTGAKGSGDNGGSDVTVTTAVAVPNDTTTSTLPSGETTTVPPTTLPPFDPEAANGKELYGQHCQVCHGVAANSEVKGADVAAINNAMKTVPAMKGVSAITAAERALIGDFLKSLVESLRRQPRLGHRFHIAAKLRDIFTPALKTTALTNSFEVIVSQEVTASIAAFGGSCGRQDANCARSSEAVDASEAPNANLLRRGLLIAACNRLTAQNAIVSNMMAHLTLTNPDAAQVKRLVEWMYPMLNDTREIEAAMLNVANALTGENNLEKWRLLMDRLCSAPLMELL